MSHLTVLSQMNPNVWQVSSQEMGPGYHSVASQAYAGTKHGWVRTTTDNKSAGPDFRARRCLPSSSTTRDLWQLMFLPANSTLTRLHYTETVLPTATRRSTSCAQLSLTRKSSSSMKMPVPTNKGHISQYPSLAQPTVQSQPYTMRLLILSSLERQTSWEEVFLCPRHQQRGQFTVENNPQRIPEGTFKLVQALAKIHQCWRRALWETAAILNRFIQNYPKYFSLNNSFK